MDVSRFIALVAGVVMAALAACAATAPADTGPLRPCIAWDLGELARCGTVEVAENRSLAGGRRLPLRVMLLGARGARVSEEPIVVLTGGPGMAATTMARYADDLFGDLRDDHDVLLVDQRGTGSSAPLECGLYEDVGRAQPYIEPMFPLERVRACASTLVSRADLAQYTTAASADDLDEVRAALGYRRVNLFGVSYGSRLALDYMRRHPGAVRSATLLGVSPPEAPVLLAAGGAGARALTHALEQCAGDAGCHAAAPDPRRDLASLLAALRAAPAKARIWNPRRLSYETVVLTPRGVAERLWAAGYDPASLERLLPLVHEAAAGRYEPLARTLVADGRGRRRGRSEGLMLSVLCAEDAPRLTRGSSPEPASPTTFGAPVMDELLRACASWPVHAVPGEWGAPVQSEAPTLLISGAWDPVTPPELAGCAARTLPNRRLYEVPDGGHGAVDAAARELIRSFVRDPRGAIANGAGPVPVTSSCDAHEADGLAHREAIDYGR